MSDRAQIVADLGQHLYNEIHSVTMRHLLVMRAAGMKPAEGVAAALVALDEFSFTTFGMAVANAEPQKRASDAESLIIEHAATLRSKIPRITDRLAAMDKRRNAL